MKSSNNKIIQFITESPFVVFFLWNIIGNGFVLYKEHYILSVLFILLFSLSLATVENIIYHYLPKFIAKIFFIIVGILYNILIIVDIFLISNFQNILNEDNLEILLETNIDEAFSFVHTYISIETVIVYALFITFINSVFLLVNRLVYKIINIQSRIFHISVIFVNCIFILILFFEIANKSFSFLHYSSLTRVSYSYHILKKRAELYNNLAQICINTKANKNNNSCPNIVVVIGESYSLYHSSVYGYKLPTNPRIQKLINDSVLIAFPNAISFADHTSAVMFSVFSLKKNTESNYNIPLFPAVFKAAGYSSFLYDNEYFIGTDGSFLSNGAISSANFDYRNLKKYEYDDEMIDDIKVLDDYSLTIIHLMGQHYEYRDRFPQEFHHFSENNYDSNLSIEKRKMISDYDNATYYNDYVFNKIVEKYKEKDAVILYFSDHGEEIYDENDFIGHGTALKSKNLKYQIRVPFYIWISTKFIDTREEIARKILRAKEYPISTYDVPHLLIDIANINTDYFEPSRSFINEKYDKKQHRIIFHNIDYDAIK